VAKVASTSHTVLVLGESGVGKELVARSIHTQSRRHDRPFVVVDCGMLNENLLQNELFGHQKGAFTGATALKHGLFEVADTGTLFLDEIGEVSLSLQAKLLRVLETGTFRRLGSTADMKVDVRLVAATNRDLLTMSREGTFREDLFYRLNVFPVLVPPLRERRDDIPLLARHFLRRTCPPGAEKTLAPEALELLKVYPWPGNIRELQNVIESAVIIAEGATIQAQDLPVAVRSSGARADVDLSENMSLEELERRYISILLERFEGHRAKVARVLQISERNLYRKLRAYHLEDAGAGAGPRRPAARRRADTSSGAG
jgi:DNA-binding NtrC family response regulator